MKALAFVLGYPLFAQQPIHLTLDQAVQTALRQNPAVVAAGRGVEAADARIQQVRADYFPQVGFYGIAKAGLSGATNALNLVGLPNSPFYRNFADSLTAYQNVFDFGRRQHRIARERHLRDALEAEQSATEASVILQTQRSYYAILRAQRLRDATVEVVRSQESTVRQAQAFYEGQIRSRVELELARAGLSRAHLQLLEAQSDIRLREAELDRAMGSSQDATYLLDEPSPDLPSLEPVDPLVEEADRVRPELLSIRAQRIAAEEAVGFARSQRKPILALTFSGGWARFTDVLARQLVSGGAGLILPLFTGGRLDGQIEEAQALLRQMEGREEDLKQQVVLEIRAADVHLRNALASLPVLRIQADAARQALRLASERYNERLSSIVELNQVQSNLAQALAGEATGLYEVKIAESELRHAVGRR